MHIYLSISVGVWGWMYRWGWSCQCVCGDACISMSGERCVKCQRMVNYLTRGPRLYNYMAKADGLLYMPRSKLAANPLQPVIQEL